MSLSISVGAIVGVHGVKGVVKVKSHLEGDSIFRTGTCVVLEDDLERTTTRAIEWAKPHGRLFLIQFEGLTRREQAEELIGRRIHLEKDDLPELAEGEYYWSELIGLSVYSIEGQYLGKIADIIATGSNDVYVVRDGRKEKLIPALESVVREVDLARGRMRVELPEGL